MILASNRRSRLFNLFFGCFMTRYAYAYKAAAVKHLLVEWWYAYHTEQAAVDYSSKLT